MKDYLIQVLGETEGTRVYELYEKNLQNLCNNITGKSKNQEKTMKEKILTKIALYQVLKKEEKYQDKAYELVRKYAHEIIGAQMNQTYRKMEKIPFFFAIYARGFLKVTRSNDCWKTRNAYRKKNVCGVEICQCLWYDTCKENGCTELCKIFCDTDYVTYGNLKKMKLVRSKTLGTGGDCCDFNFEKR